MFFFLLPLPPTHPPTHPPTSNQIQESKLLIFRSGRRAVFRGLNAAVEKEETFHDPSRGEESFRDL